MNEAHAIPCRRHPHQRNGARHGIVFAASLVTAGGLFLLDHLGQLGGYAAWQFWPLLLVYLGISNLHPRHRVGSWIWGLGLITGGGLGLAHTLGLADVRWDLIWPVGLVLAGACVLFGVVAYRRRRKGASRAAVTGDASGSVLMAERRDRCDDQQFDGGDLSAVMGTLEMDLSGARMQGPEADLNVKVVMGEIKLRIPRDWQAVVAGTPVLGEVKDHTRGSTHAGETPPRLVVHCDVVMGTVEITD
jgi:hypothetical protein